MSRSDAVMQVSMRNGLASSREGFAPDFSTGALKGSHHNRKAVLRDIGLDIPPDTLNSLPGIFYALALKAKSLLFGLCSARI